MKVNEPITDEEKAAADVEHARIAQNQKDYLNKIAAKLESKEYLNVLETEWAAGAIRAFSDSIPLDRPQPKGRPAIIPEAIVLRYCFEVKKRIDAGDAFTKTDIYKYLADEFEVYDVGTIEKRISSLIQREKDLLKVFGLEDYASYK